MGASSNGNLVTWYLTKNHQKPSQSLDQLGVHHVFGYDKFDTSSAGAWGWSNPLNLDGKYEQYEDITAWWCNKITILQNDGRLVNGKDDIPDIKWKNQKVWNHQPDQVMILQVNRQFPRWQHWAALSSPEDLNLSWKNYILHMVIHSYLKGHICIGNVSCIKGDNMTIKGN